MSRRRLIRHARNLFASAVPVVLGAGSLVPLVGCGSGVVGSPVTTSTTTPTTIPSAVKSGPQLGYIWSDKTKTLRPVLGIPGSSQLGESVVPADLYLTAASSAVSNLAILQESDGVLDLMSLPTGSPRASLPPPSHPTPRSDSHLPATTPSPSFPARHRSRFSPRLGQPRTHKPSPWTQPLPTPRSAITAPSPRPSPPAPSAPSLLRARPTPPARSPPSAVCPSSARPTISSSPTPRATASPSSAIALPLPQRPSSRAQAS